MASKRFVIGVDYGTDSVRSVVVDADSGKMAGSDVQYYPRWKAGKFCNPGKQQFRQHPLDYIEGLEKSIRNALKKSPKGAAQSVAGIAIDTTGSTPVAVNQDGTPLALLPEFKNNPNAMFVLWKDHTAVEEAATINKIAKSWGGEDFTKYVGGIYSSEWFWAKILHVLREDPRVRKAAYSWVEHCDWMPALLSGTTNPRTMKRSRCAAGHKAMWHESFSGLPSEEFLVKVDPLLGGLRDRLYRETHTSDQKAGGLSEEWAKRLGLRPGVAIAVGAFDAHMGAVGAMIEPYALTKVIGTSTCDMLVLPNEELGSKLVRGICGQVDGSVIPGMAGLEAGQSAFGDVFAWFKSILSFPIEQVVARSKTAGQKVKQALIEEAQSAIIPALDKAAQKVSPAESSVMALDWMNGRRTPDANQRLKGAITGISLGTDAPHIYRALVESTAFGAKRILDRFESEGVPVKSIIALGGIPKKSPFVMQILSDVMNRNIRVSRSDQACALGAAMFAATAAGLYPKVDQAQKSMGCGFEKEYKPRKESAELYAKIFEKYSRLGEFVEKELTN